MSINKFKIDNGTNFIVYGGEIFGIGGTSDFVNSLYSAVNLFNSDTAVRSVELVSGHVITRG